jgi:hypothetical protein
MTTKARANTFLCGIEELLKTRTTDIVMISPFNENGYLPPGVRKASLDEIAEQFVRQAEVRSSQRND